MKPVFIVSFLVFGLGLLGAAMWLGNQAAPPVEASGANTANFTPPPEIESPALSPRGPYPKAVVPEAEFDFGTLMHQADSSHDYVIKNTGEAPLKVWVGRITCNCTGATIAHADPIEPGEDKNAKPGQKATIAPGEETTVTLSWKVKDPNPSFRHSAKILTNDPENLEIELVVKGKVEQGLQYAPPGAVWDMGDAGDQTVLESQKAIFSNAIESFRILHTATSSPRLKVKAEPMDAATLEKYQAKSGYLLHLTVDVADITGNLNERVTIRSDLPNDVGADMAVKVRKQGPIELIGRNWNPEVGRLSLGEFPAKEGRQIELNVFTRVAEEVNLVSATSEHDAVKFTWEKDESFKSKSNKLRRYRLKVQVPPGQAAVNRRLENADKVDLKFDHPSIGTMKIMVDYLSL